MVFWPEHKRIGWFPPDRPDKVRVMDYFQARRDCPWGSAANRFCDFSGLEGFDLDHTDVAQDDCDIRIRVLGDLEEAAVRLGIGIELLQSPGQTRG
jgi:hypothetical protein